MNEQYPKGPAGSTHERTVIVWREGWLAGSETFIRNQVAAMKRWTPVPTGLYKINSPVASQDDDVASCLPPRGRLRARVNRARMTRTVIDQHIRSVEPSIVHVHFLKDAAQVVPLARKRGIPTVVTVHGFDITSWPDAGHALYGSRWLLKLYRRHVLRRLFRDATAFVAVSEAIRQCLLSRGAPPERVHVLPIGVPTETDRALDDLDSRRGVLFVGRLVPVKGADHLLRAWSQLPSDDQREGLTIVGDGPLRVSLEEQAERLGIDVTFTGSVSPAEVRQLMRSAAVLCNPSRTAPEGDAEGFGMVFLEAAAQGLAIISNRHGGIPEAVLDGVTGLLADENDVAQLRTNIHSLLSDNQARMQLARAGYERVHRDFDIRARTADLEALYDHLAGAGKPRSLQHRWLS